MDFSIAGSEAVRVKCRLSTVSGDIGLDLGNTIKRLKRRAHHPTFVRQLAASIGRLPFDEISGRLV